MKKILTILFACIAWFAVIVQLILMIDNRTVALLETVIRFFSFFTILTNTLVAIYFTAQARIANKGILVLLNRPGALSAITVYITIVGLVYQFVLRQIWEPTGLQQMVDELLHSINPILVLVYWFLYEQKKNVSYKQIPSWLIYPLGYLLYILVRGNFSGFYPYPFVNVSHLGLSAVLVNSAVLTCVFGGLSIVLVWLGKLISKR